MGALYNVNVEIKGLRIREEGLRPEALEYLESKLRRQRRQAKRRRNPLHRLFHALIPRDFRPVPIESSLEGECLFIGCGGGLETISLGMVGIDVDAPALRAAVDLNAHVDGARARFLRASGGDLPFPDAAFDSLLSDNVVEHIPGPILPRHFRETVRVLRPGGRYLLSTPNRLFEQPAKEAHISLHSYAEWRDYLLEAGFREVRTPRRRSGEFVDLSWKLEQEQRAAASGRRLGLSRRGIREAILLAIR